VTPAGKAQVACVINGTTPAAFCHCAKAGVAAHAVAVDAGTIQV